ncbi:MAG: T9SS C-terminal target domain-containing protein [Ignavibacteriae bacterium]|nr:MAG: T9SS C-terminal target domain-containing protein [Ignavibacteriota bacterium]
MENMKNKYTVLKMLIIPLLISIVIGFNYDNSVNVNTGIKTPELNKVNYAAELISKAGNNFNKASIFSISNKDNSKALDEFAKTASFLTLDSKEIKKLYNAGNKNIILEIPVSTDNNLEIELTRVNIFSKDFEVKLSDGRKVNYKPGLYYRGIIKGNSNSIAAVSIFENSVIGIISNEDGDYVLGTIKDKDNNNTSEYIFYNDKDLKVKSKFRCDVEDSYGKLYKGSSYKHITTGQKDATSDAIAVYFVADYQTYLDAGSNQTNLINFVTGMFNNTALLYNNESIPTEISGFYIHNSADPYLNYSESFGILKRIGGIWQDDYPGDLIQLISTRTDQSFGGIAWVNVLCQSFNPGDSSGRFSFSNIETSYNNYPTYSWTVHVVTHELGHNVGSMHTHACVWPVLPSNGIGAIDSCVQAEGTCFTTTRANYNGTIMSYCHIDYAVNFTKGFGPLPGDTIRYAYSLARCLDSALNSSELPLAYNLLQNYPNPFNPSTTITFALPEEGFVTLTVYDITGREVVKLVNNQVYNAGVFKTYFNTTEHSMASGVYLYRIDVIRNNSSKYSQIRKMVLIK